jgi:amidase
LFLSSTFVKMASVSPRAWEHISHRKKEEQRARIPEEWRLKALPGKDTTNLLDVPRSCGLLSKEELRITEEFDAVALGAEIRERRLRCVDVCRAFCKVGAQLEWMQ